MKQGKNNRSKSIRNTNIIKKSIKKNNKRTTKKNKKIRVYNKKGGSMKTCACVDYDRDNNNNIVLNNLDNNGEVKPCTNPVKDGSDFCVKHQNCGQYIKTLVNGFEHQFAPAEWNHPYLEGSHNCYTYFLNNQNKAVKDRCKELCHKHSKECPKKISRCGNLKPQPGDYARLLNHGDLNKGPNKYSCPLMEKRIFGDNDSIKKVKYNDKCPKYYYKGAMVVDPGHTYHFYRQNPDGTWSHKPGTLEVTNKDASDRVIYVPHGADRNYNKDKKKDGINYVDFCGYYCVPNNKYLNTHAI